MLEVGTLFLRSKNGKQFAKEVWGLIDHPARIGRVRGLHEPFSRQTKSLSLSGWKNGLCGVSFIDGDKEVFVAEGEKDYLAIDATGIYGSGVFATSASLSPTHFQALKDKDVVVFAQADESGVTGVQKWVTHLPESTRIFIPETAGNDWADVLNALTPAEARETLQQLTPFTREQFLSLDPARYPIPVAPAVHHPNLDVSFMLRVYKAVQQLPSRSVAAILDHLGMPKNKASRSKIYRQLKNVGEYETEIVSGYL
jgi:5S rRNA maturation endonuclease (ribonuclease M5)